MAHPELKTVKWNIRKLVKDLLLLEEHLADVEQRCPDCIWKHLLRAEAWTEEAAQLDNRREWSPILESTWTDLQLIQTMVQQKNLTGASHQTRYLRKQLQPLVV